MAVVSAGAGSDAVPKRYAVIVDAGSSGSRAHVFEWPEPEQYRAQQSRNQTALESVLPVKLVTTDRTRPGISSFAGETDEIWSDHLKQLVSTAKEVVPPDQQYETPVFFLATAGMRLLPELDQQEILGEVCRLLQTQSGFYVPECETHVAVIDGETEGLFGWLALNYLLGTLRADEPQSYGFMDMGGASAQIAFAPNTTEADRHSDDLFHVALRSVDGGNLDWDVFVSTWLGFGANRAYERLAETLVDKGIYKNPCMPWGLEDIININGTESVSQTKIVGSGSFDECLAAMVPLLNKGLPCKDDPCLFNGQHVPAFDFKTNKFVGVSEFWYTANDVFNMGGKYDFVQFSEKTREFCETPWSDILINSGNGAYNDTSEEVLRMACFKSSWVISILHDGFGIPYGSQVGESVTRANKRLQRRLVQPEHIDFLDPFQSAVDVNGVELSWALGRAILYSSSQVRASSANKEMSVGYIPSGGTSSNLVIGGELASSPAPYPSSWDSTAYGVHYLLLSVLSLAVLVWWAFHCVGSTKWRRYSPMALVRRLRKREAQYGDIESEAAQRLMEEGIALKSYPSTPASSAADPVSMLGSTTSMLDLSSRAPSRVSSRLSMRTDARAQFSLD
jgi:Golgi apyrase